MKKKLSNCACYVLHFDSRYDVEIFGSVTEVVNYLADQGLNETKKEIRLKVIDCINNYREFVLTKDLNDILTNQPVNKRGYNYFDTRGYNYFVSKHIVKVESKLSRK